jgi:hypothetical protein
VAAVAKPKTDDILSALGAAQPAMEAKLGADSCIACTRIAVDTLRAFGVRARPLAVEVVIHNADAAAHIERGEPETADRDPSRSTGSSTSRSARPVAPNTASSSARASSAHCRGTSRRPAARSR